MSTVYPLGTPSDWRGIHGKPYITVSSKGLSNGRSSRPNGGSDFGPDTMLNATSPNQYGPPYTQTIGAMEAINYCLANGIYIVKFIDANYVLNNVITIDVSKQVLSSNHGPLFTIAGNGTSQTYMYANNSNGIFNIINSPDYFAIVFRDIQLTPYPGASPAYAIQWNTTSTGNSIGVENINWSTAWSNATLLTSGVESVAQKECVAFGGTNLKISGATYVYNINDINTGAIDAYENCGYVSYSGGEFYAVYGISSPTQAASYLTINDAYQTGSIGAGFGTVILHNIYVLSFSYGIYFLGPGTGIGNLVMDNVDFSPINATGLTFTDGTITNQYLHRCRNLGIFSPLPTSTLPSLPANPPVSGSPYQNKYPYDIIIKIPVTYNPTSTAAATLATGISSTSTITTTTKVSKPAGLTATDGEIDTYEMRVPANWYFKIVVTNATIGTVEVQAA